MGRLQGLRDAKRLASGALNALGGIKKCPYCSKRLAEVEACAKMGHVNPVEVVEEVGSQVGV